MYASPHYTDLALDTDNESDSFKYLTFKLKGGNVALN